MQKTVQVVETHWLSVKKSPGRIGQFKRHVEVF